MTSEITSAAALVTEEADRWAPLSKIPARTRFGFLGIAFNAIENKLDARFLIALATSLTAVVTGLLWFFSIGSAFAAMAGTCQNLAASVYYAPWLIVGVLTGLIVGRLIWRWRRSRLIRKVDRHSEFDIIQRTTLCHVKSPKEIDYYYRFIVRAKVDNVRSFSMKFQWTGTRKRFDVRIRNPSFTQSFPKDSDWKDSEIVIHFNRNLCKGEEEVIDFCFETETEEGSEAAPVLGLLIASSKYPKFNTHLAVVFEPSVKVASIYRREYFSPIASTAAKSTVVALDGERMHRWPVPIRPGWRFVIRWIYG